MPGWLAGGGSGDGLASTPDLTAWTTRPNDFGGAYAIAANSSLWVVSDFAGIWTSPDTATWTFRTSPADDGQVLGICWTGTQFVAVGGMSDGEHIVMTSPDGLTWTQRDTPADGGDVTLAAVAAAGDTIVAVGTRFGHVDGRAILASTDAGITWTQHVLSSDPGTVTPWTTVASCTINSSPSGAPTAPGDDLIEADLTVGSLDYQWQGDLPAGYAGAFTELEVWLYPVDGTGTTGFLTVGVDGLGGLVPRPGFPTSTVSLPVGVWTRIAVAGRYVTAGTTTTVRVEVDGDASIVYQSTRITPSPTSSLNTVGVSGGVWLAGAQGGDVIVRSTDTVAWTEITGTPLDGSNVLGLAYGAGRWVAGGETAASDTVLMTSDDAGLTWTARTTPADGSYVQNVLYAAGKFVGAAGSDPPVISSADGITWVGHESDALGTNGTYVIGYGPLVSGIPPLRYFPRDDAVGGSPRTNRSSTSRQSSARQGWTNTYR